MAVRRSGASRTGAGKPATSRKPASAASQLTSVADDDPAEAAEAAEAEDDEAPAAPMFDLTLLAAGATVAPALPKSTRNGKGQHPLNPLLERSITEEVALTLPPVAGEINALKLQNALRRSATLLSTSERKVGVNIRKTVTADGIALTFQARVVEKK